MVLPRCIPQASDGILLVWDETTVYPKDVFTISLSDIQDRGFDLVDDLETDCAHWKVFTAAIKENGSLSGKGLTRLEGNSLHFSADMATRIAQIRLGAHAYHPEKTGAEYLAHHPISSYTRELNRQLTALYGLGFSGDIYWAYLNSDARTKEIQAEISSQLSNLNGSTDEKLRRRLSQYLVLFAQGYMQTPASNRLKPLIEELEHLGAAVEVLDFDPLGTVKDNVPRLKASLLGYLKSGRKVILAGGCKGVPEMLTALGELSSEHPEVMHQIAASIDLAGMFQGTFLADWASQFPQSLLVGKILAPEAKSVGLNWVSADGLFSMSTDSIAAQVSEYSPMLFKDIPYFNFVGVLTHDGLAHDPEISMLQKSIAYQISPDGHFQGASDGYIEYPGTTPPSSFGIDSVNIPFEASHAILDGYYQGRDLQRASDRHSVICAIFSVILNRIEKGSQS